MRKTTAEAPRRLGALTVNMILLSEGNALFALTSLPSTVLVIIGLARLSVYNFVNILFPEGLSH